jgi:hypothetical protein
VPGFIRRHRRHATGAAMADTSRQLRTALRARRHVFSWLAAVKMMANKMLRSTTIC